MSKQDIQEEVYDMLESQMNNWPLLDSNIKIYDNAPFKEILFNDCFWATGVILLNYRKASLTANLDSIAKGERPCFLCKSARPSEQKYLEWEDYEILLNPYPASWPHLTIVNKQHIPQSLGVRISTMARLARRLPDMAIFYNGPTCGASAPDHMHFQAVNREEAINYDIDKAFFSQVAASGKSSIYVPHKNMSPFGYLMMDVKADKDIMPMFGSIIRSLSFGTDAEPMINAVVFKKNSSTRIIIIPRKSHRPSCYGDGEGEMLISPASLEMMGYFITSRDEDFDRLDETAMTKIYSEVAYSHNELREMMKSLVL